MNVGVAVGVPHGPPPLLRCWTSARNWKVWSYYASYTPDLSRAVEPGLVSLTIGQYQVRW